MITQKTLDIWAKLGSDALKKEISKTEKNIKKLEDKLWNSSQNTFTGGAKFRSSFFKSQNKLDVERQYLERLREISKALSF